jgi:hypothetical protein
MVQTMVRGYGFGVGYYAMVLGVVCTIWRGAYHSCTMPTPIHNTAVVAVPGTIVGCLGLCRGAARPVRVESKLRLLDFDFKNLLDSSYTRFSTLVSTTRL